MKQVCIFAENAWAIGRIHHDLEKYLSNEFEFIYINWGDQDDIIEKSKYIETCDVIITLLIGYKFLFNWWPNANLRKCLFICHGFEEFCVEMNPLATHAMTSKSVAHLFPSNITPIFTPNCVELDHFTRKEHSGNVNTIGWCGAPRVWFKQFDWAKEIAKQLGTKLHVSSKTPFEDPADWVALPFDDLVKWYSTLDILLITSIPNGESETGPLPAFEAIAAGVVVIGTSVGNFAEVPGPKFSTIEEAVSIINELKADPERVKQIAREQYQCIVEKWNYRVVSHYWRDALHKVLQLSLIKPVIQQKKKVLVYGPVGWSVERVHLDVEKYLKDEFEFTYYDWRKTDFSTFDSVLEDYDLCLTQIASIQFFKDNNVKVDLNRCLFVSHGGCEFNNVVLPNEVLNYGMTSYEISQFFPKNNPLYLMRNGVEPSHFRYTERNGQITTFGWCGEPKILSKNYTLGLDISNRTGIPLLTASSLTFPEMKEWYHTIDILLITSGPEKWVETGPLPAFEAIISGALVIGTSIGNFSKIPGPKFSTLEEAITIINKLKQNPEEVKRLANIQLDTVMKYWTYSSISNEWRSAFNSVLSRSSFQNRLV